MINLIDFVIPAIDIKEGKVVRLKGGDFSKVNKYADNPADVAKLFCDKGFKRLHVVDLDAAKEGRPVNKKSIVDIRKYFNGEIELGGGIRSGDAISVYISEGIDYFVIGTLAIKNRDLFLDIVNKFPNRIILAIDSKGGKVAIEGWIHTSDISPEVLVKEYDNEPLWGYLYTIVEKDGMLEGVNIEPYLSIKRITKKPVIASGGVASLKDIELLKGKVDFVVVGKAIYEGLIKL